MGVGKLDGKVALITGAARGQGEAEARLFAREGARVVVADVLDDEAASVAADLGDAARAVHLDVTDEASWAAGVEAAVLAFGGLDVLVSNAGIIRTGALEELSLELYRSIVDVNQVGCFLGMRAVVPAMRVGGGGSIVNVSSTAGMQGGAGLVAYAASKWAVRGMTRCAAIELGPHGIRVNAVVPGVIETPMIDAPDFAGVDRDAAVATLPVARLGQPVDVANMALFLASDDSAYCSGSDFLVEGGALAGRPPSPRS
jgi:3alpha(or 20beta)-hydroxysteroid dehydrogenase